MPKSKICSRCGLKKLLSEFHVQSSVKDGLSPACKECNRERMRLYYKSLSTSEKEKRQLRTDTWQKNHPARYREICKRIVARARTKLLYEYGGKNPKCACCGESRWQFLAIDHIDGGGNQHKKKEGFSHLGRWLKIHGYPKKGFQILCHNCNAAKGFYGECPHKLLIQKKYEDNRAEKFKHKTPKSD